MRHILAAVGVAACLIAPAPAASADTAHCVSKAEFRNAKQGMTKKRVHRIFDVAGKQTSVYVIGGDRYESREYRPCHSSYGFVMVDFTNNRLDSKYAYWG